MGEHFLHLPPGFRFHPSDEELIVHYLRNKVKQRSLPASVIGEINLYNFDPWDLPNKALFGKDEWFFFTPRDKKYPNGSRPNRSAGSGFWKATEKDKPILGSSGSTKIGLKKALAFFTGSPTSSKKTNWIMIEYRLPESSTQSSISMRLDDWVLCRIRQKGNNSKNISQVQEYSNNKSTHGQTPTMAQELHSPYMITNPRFDIVSNRRFNEIQLMASILVGQGIPSLTKTCSPKLLQRDNTSFEYENGAIYKENFTFEQGWIV
ncbi:putative transcription factor NAM family [Helianthus annuus]|uniref:Transcription factor NAM family n=1 Tax=Helianthus annuus TaxID=4232 RepID=A0A9K3EIF1_HELAN|nr:putative transcription factor NAM family [Helianthus annuus]KAJ0477022.1 putative transcription factor NAM family [Helianthus annuus]KAJ0481385.1 putative transcription factor NAM family [Helianthus annuus]KAJ0497845.1 putative transcription factor NAM family [Helianthus annuus]KAJ0663853.1 putative transcription factor NAM family [Helianthus annuus]